MAVSKGSGWGESFFFSHPHAHMLISKDGHINTPATILRYLPVVNLESILFKYRNITVLIQKVQFVFTSESLTHYILSGKINLGIF